MSYIYKVYGLTIESEILIPELTILKDFEKENIDVKIGYKEMNLKIKKALKEGKIAEYKSNDMWFYIKNVATYHIYEGNNVDIEPCIPLDSQMINIYILGSVLGMILIQRNMVAIHGGGIVMDGRGYIFTGHKGAGKSTLTTALRQKEYKFVSDDVCAIRDGTINMINPGFGYQKLCEDTMVKLGYDISKFKIFRSDNIVKYSIPVFNQFINKEIPLEAIFEIIADDTTEVKIEEILGSAKLDRMIENIFRIEMIYNAGGMSGTYLKKCVNIAKDIKYYKIIRPKNTFSVKDQIKAIENIIFNKKVNEEVMMI